MSRNAFCSPRACLLGLSGALLAALAGCGAAAPPTAQTATAAEEPATPAAAPAAAAVPKAEVAAPATADAGPIARTAAKPVISNYSSDVPPVMLTEGAAKLCKVVVGDQFPSVQLAKLGGGNAALASLAGKKATIVLLWTPDRWMARTALSDLAKDVVAKNDAASVAVVGVALGKQDAVQAELGKTEAKFPQLLDSQETTLAEVGGGSLPRIYVLDSSNKIAWFDIEYSEATRRELAETLAALTK